MITLKKKSSKRNCLESNQPLPGRGKDQLFCKSFGGFPPFCVCLLLRSLNKTSLKFLSIIQTFCRGDNVT